MMYQEWDLWKGLMDDTRFISLNEGLKCVWRGDGSEWSASTWGLEVKAFSRMRAQEVGRANRKPLIFGLKLSAFITENLLIWQLMCSRENACSDLFDKSRSGLDSVLHFLTIISQWGNSNSFFTTKKTICIKDGSTDKRVFWRKVSLRASLRGLRRFGFYFSDTLQRQTFIISTKKTAE